MVRSTHSGVVFRFGRYPKLLKPGVRWVWPALDEYEIVPVERQTNNLPGQRLVTKDGRTILVSGIVVYSVVDVVALLTHTWDYEQTLVDHALAAVKDAVTRRSLAELSNKPRAVDRRVTARLQSDLEPFGICVLRVTLSDMAPCLVVAGWSD